MSRSSNKKYRSYRDKKSQTKRFRTYFVRILFLIVFYSLFTSFIALTIGVNSDSMLPSLNQKDSLILLPSKNLDSVLKQNLNSNLRRGELVLTSTNYSKQAGLFEHILDPIVRIFTLQKRSLLYDNEEYRGRGELLRVVGIPGDSIKIKDSTVYIKTSDGVFFLSEFELTEIDYDISKKNISKVWKTDFPFSTELDEVYIETGQYFLIADNRETINDSRIFGAIDESHIIGRVLLKYWPLNEFKIF
ncbi:MAG: signal peptidase I [Spirochaetaceae bacterium]